MFNDIHFKLTVIKRNHREKYGFNSTKRQFKFRWLDDNIYTNNKIMMIFWTQESLTLWKYNIKRFTLNWNVKIIEILLKV